MNPWHLVLALVGYNLAREAWNAYIVHKLLNKLMSRNYQDYVFKPNPSKIEPPHHSASQEEEPMEDLRVLAGIN